MMMSSDGYLAWLDHTLQVRQTATHCWTLMILILKL